MGDILFHLTPAEEELLLRHTLALPMSEASRKEALVVSELHELNKLFAAPSDTQKSADGYGVEDRSKT
jgi:hypothetical protein